MFHAKRWDDRETHYWPSFHPPFNASELAGEESLIVAWNFRRHGGSGSSVVATPRRDDHRNGESSVNHQDRGPSGMMWVDAVGGYLVYLQDEITIGQAAPSANVDLPIFGDLSRQHAVVRRVGEDYLVCPIGPVTLDGQSVTAATCLADGSEVGLGKSIRLRFRQPSVLSNTARLDIISHHRTSPKADGILLIGQTCLLGPEADNHLVCRDWRARTILVPQDNEGFQFKANHPVTVDDQTTSDHGLIRWGSRLASDDFAFYLERL